MAVYIALLHSIVLGGGRRVVMSDLRAMAESIGFSDVKTLVATGNLVFEADAQPIAEIEARLEAGFAKSFGKAVDIIARDAETWRRLAAGNPFSDGKGSEVVVRVMRKPLEPSVIAALGKHRNDPERLAVVDGDLWIDFGGKASETRLLSALTTKRLGVGTLRNWNTVRGLVEMIGE
ncbi:MULTISPECIES: DUF1697 domain-containing protein [Rhizobium]|uniref:Uncharacterized protein (DUF1697 family) n=1 Tax=Rhizobium paranaense TaxID=1650438 RepID=A0A7W8XND0_9HYPH|nr:MULTISPECIES: DUF1697 domain-containing protein [Rhizobium]MBB5572608.1 uncharacterized protein (DUF1697 family) [Rhizobium paranaense]PST63636.1 hypothetical protein C9E91_09840 [Rhizobium sp. SEMIA4064]